MDNRCTFITDNLKMCTRKGTINNMCWQHIRMRTCCVCLERIYDTSSGVDDVDGVLSCSHSFQFHKECLGLCISKECPLCRAPFLGYQRKFYNDEEWYISDDDDDDYEESIPSSSLDLQDDFNNENFIIRFPASLLFDILSDDPSLS